MLKNNETIILGLVLLILVGLGTQNVLLALKLDELQKDIVSNSNTCQDIKDVIYEVSRPSEIVSND